MTTITDLLFSVGELRLLASEYVEEAYRTTLAGEAFSRSVADQALHIIQLSKEAGIPTPTIIVSGSGVEEDDLEDEIAESGPWRMIIGKSPIAQQIPARPTENTLLFFSVEGFHKWLQVFDPFLYPSGSNPDLACLTTIRVVGLATGFGGSCLWILPTTPYDTSSLETQGDEGLPSFPSVHSLIHTRSAKPLRVCPSAFSLSWGDLDSEEAAPVVELASKVLSACLVQELKSTDTSYEATIRGTKRISLMLFNSQQQEANKFTLELLINTVRWVYEERPETRVSLVMDRLSIDLEENISLLSGMHKHLENALQQAKDSYSFVILERKDAYLKEMREIMKDMKSQADLYASKVRDLIASLTRDILGILVFFGFSFLGKFDQKNLHSLLSSNELSLLTKFLAGYLLLSCALQISAHWRDSTLAYEESKKWLDVLQHYSTQVDKQTKFIEPIDKRRVTLFIAMTITTVIYIFLILIIWKLPFVMELLLAQ